jgi:hypothetical protein
MASVWAITWRANNVSDSFLQAFKPRRDPVAIVEMSEMPAELGGSREVIHLKGYGTQLQPEDCTVVFGGARANRFYYNFALRLRVHANSQTLNPVRNPSLMRIGLELHAARRQAVYRDFQLGTAPRLPSGYLGFQGGPPECQDTPALRARVAQVMGKPVQAIDDMPAEERDPFLRAEWLTCFVDPLDPINNTGMYLLPQQFCSRAGLWNYDFLRFDGLVGEEVANPIADIIGLGKYRDERMQVSNPATTVLKEVLGVASLEEIQYSTPEEDPLTPDVLRQLHKRMWEELGPLGRAMRTEDLDEALQTPTRAITLPKVADPIAAMGEAATIAMMRACCPVEEACRDEDLLAAARNPGRYLLAAGLVKTQVLYVRAYQGPYLRFTEQQLGASRVLADFYSVRREWCHERVTS